MQDSQEPHPLEWYVSSYTGKGNCVQVADLFGARLVRDSKNPQAGTLRMPASEWIAFIRQAAAD